MSIRREQQHRIEILLTSPRGKFRHIQVVHKEGWQEWPNRRTCSYLVGDRPHCYICKSSITSRQDQQLAPTRIAPARKPSRTYLCVRVTQLDSNISLQLILESNGLYSGDGLDHCRLSMSYMSDSTDVDLFKVERIRAIISH